MKFFLIAAAVVLLAVIYLSIDYTVGRMKHIQAAKEHKSPFFYGWLDIFTHGPELFSDYFKELNKAKSHIHVIFYIVSNDAISREFLKILKRKAEEGVEVRLLLDRIGSMKAPKKLLAAMENSGVHFAYCNRPKPPFFFYSSQVRNHRKVTVIDGQIGYLGGFNVGKEYLDLNPKLSPWRDYHLKLTGEGVLFLQHEFLIDWKEYAGIDLRGNSFYFPEPLNSGGGIKHQFVATEAVQLEDFHLGLLQTAKESIFIGTPYFIPSSEIFMELKNALRRGVRLTVIVPAVSDHILVKEASYRYLRPLLKEGANVFQFQNGFYHAKVLMIDDRIADIGTANFDKRSLYLNKEINCYIFDPAFIARIKNILNKDQLDSKPLLLEDLTKPDLLRSCKEAAATALSHFL